MRTSTLLTIPRQLLTALLLIAGSLSAYAQKADSVYNKYTDMNLERLQGHTASALNLALQILPVANQLPAKTQIPFYNSLAKLYEDTQQFDKARPLYEKVIAAEPDYYVAHLALGHLYLDQAKELTNKLNASKGDAANYQKLRAEYIAMAKKALPHLEKVQACDPYDENLQLIKQLYTNIGDAAAFNQLPARLKPLQKKCVDILNDN
ncbi:tetratricopeptide repeat protein [Mucilaginibacter daejeonensis]|uniref:tetratricopeptide repeat protein n=1 Tax=Mucilaginibacter daejeonensis TaxID=398049 RepID=UPI001D173BDD|nr:tetratricopeptide repeat protein [Mucilaginibacter daejeonensis]UEG52403.1 tetratricopeptide repeat protein [Mucilaginibacter daejeonensis]